MPDEPAWQLSWLGVLGAAAYVLALLSIPSVMLQRRGRPQAAVSWVLILFSLPVVGLFLWWAIGRRHMARRKRKRRRAAARISRRLDKLQEELHDLPVVDWPLMPIKRLPEADAEWLYRPTSGNSARLLVDAAEAYPTMEGVIESATHHVHVMFYIWQADKTGRHFRDLLAAKARAGVEVRMLLDAYGGRSAGGRFLDPLREAGARVATFMKPRFFQRRLEINFRNHRKLVLADSREAVIGGLNIGDEYRSDWHDMALHLSGPIADQLQEVFADDWFFATGEEFADRSHFGGWVPAQEDARRSGCICGIIASGPHTEFNLTHEAFFAAINTARERIYLTTPYFVPDQTILAALRSAAFRGVDVRVLLPERADHRVVDWASRSYWPTLLGSGVRLFLFRDGVLHAKTAVLDDELVFVGSANMDVRSFRLNFELGCFVESTRLNGELTERFLADLERSPEITLDDVERTSLPARLGEAAAHLLSPLL